MSKGAVQAAAAAVEVGGRSEKSAALGERAASAGGSAGDRDAIEQSGVEVSGSGTAGARQRKARRKTSGARRSPQCASDFVCGGRSGTPLQPGLCSICGTDGGQRET